MSKEHKHKVSAVIPTYNRSAFLDGLFESILSQTMDKSDFEIVIVNNNSTDDTEEKCKLFMKNNPEIEIRYYIETQQGVAYGRNKGATESKGEYTSFLDDDTILDPKYMENVVSFFERRKQAITMGGKVQVKFLTTAPKWLSKFIYLPYGHFDKGNKEKQLRTGYFIGANMSFRTTAFEKHGLFNTQLGRLGNKLYGSEEKEYFYRLRDAGEELWYVPSVCVTHMIPQFRTEVDFLRRQAIGIGISQLAEAKFKGKAEVLTAKIKELMKWVATFGLSLGYCLIFRFAAAIMLIRFRWWVSMGMFRGEKMSDRI